MRFKDKAWDRHAIQAEIHRQGMTLTRLSELNGLDKSACSKALKVSCPAAERAIAQFLDVELHELWPLRYRKSDRKSLLHTKPNRLGRASPSQKTHQRRTGA